MNRDLEGFDSIANLEEVMRFNSEVDAAAGILIVVVLYKQLPAESETVRTLLAAVQAANHPPLHLGIQVVDNTPVSQDVGTLPQGVRYRAALHNPGLADAYNLAIEAARLEGYQWLLTLDQDTCLPLEFLTVLRTSIERYGRDERIAALVPHILDSGRPISPFRFVGGFLPKVLPLGFSGIAVPFTSALNSASLLRVSALREIGGYDARFPMNNSDTSLFHRLGEAGKRVAVIGELTVQHELAIMNRQERMSVERYRKVLSDERAVWDLHMGFWGRVERMVRLFGRIAKDLLQGKNRELRAATLAEIRYRLLTPKRKRIEAWEHTPTSV